MLRVAGLSVREGTDTQTITTTPALCTLWATGSANAGFDVDLGQDGFVVKVPGWTYAVCSMCFSGDATHTVHAEFRVNGTTVGKRGSAEIIASGGITTLTFHDGADLNIGDVVQVYVYDDDNGTQLTLVDGQFGLLQVG